MTNIYDKLEIPEPSANLDERIIAASQKSRKKYLFPRLAMVAACLLITLVVMQPNKGLDASNNDQLAGIDFYDEQYGFADEEIQLSYDEQLLDIEFFDEQFGFADEVS